MAQITIFVPSEQRFLLFIKMTDFDKKCKKFTTPLWLAKIPNWHGKERKGTGKMKFTINVRLKPDLLMPSAFRLRLTRRVLSSSTLCVLRPSGRAE
jgi:hypothetical protein